jgi:Thiopurine S-methyltransferase (TPMT)
LSEKREERPSERPEFWSQRYLSGKTPWKLDQVPARLTEFVGSLRCPSRVLIPGCGEDHRALAAFHSAGYEVTAIDFSPVAIARTQSALPELRERIVLGDFFNHDFGAHRFDIVYERTFLCSLPPRMWNDYAKRIAGLLRPQGMLVGFFFYGEESDPPPFPLTEAVASEIFGSRFELAASEPVTDSLSIFAGNEKWQEWQLRS